MAYNKIKYTQLDNTISGKIDTTDSSIPTFKHSEGDAGYDLYASEDKWIFPFFVRKIAVNCRIEIPKGFYAAVVGRSGNNLAGNMVATGTVDSSYRGVLGVLMYRIGLLPRKIKKGTRIAQMIIAPHLEVNWTQTTELSETERGENGYGSTGMN